MRTQSRIEYISRILSRGGLAVKSAKESEQKSISHRLFADLSLIQSEADGIYALLPLLTRVQQKLQSIVDELMSDIGAHKVQCSTLGSESMWQKSDRWKALESVHFRTTDRLGINFCLQPTHEESITQMVGKCSPISSKLLPLRLYQMTQKYRDEKNPRFGILRAREFLMKDLYTFDVNEETARQSYENVRQVYDRLMHILELPIIRTAATTGFMGGQASHEYHVQSDVGQDTVHYCFPCTSGINSELLSKDESKHEQKCPQCKSQMTKLRCMEVAHTFLLGTKYSQAFDATVMPDDNTTPTLLYMGCYGIGVSRLMAACVDYLCSINTTNKLTKGGERLIWPTRIAPYKLCVVGPKEGSNEEQFGVANTLSDVVDSLNCLPTLQNDILIHDRQSQTIGRRVSEATAFGFPYILIAGKGAMTHETPMFELIRSRDGQKMDCTHAQLFDILSRV